MQITRGIISLNLPRARAFSLRFHYIHRHYIPNLLPEDDRSYIPRPTRRFDRDEIDGGLRALPNQSPPVFEGNLWAAALRDG